MRSERLIRYAAVLLLVLVAMGYIFVRFPTEREVIDIGDYYGDFSKIDKTLGWHPKVSLEQGLGKTLSYYRLHRDHYW